MPVQRVIILGAGGHAQVVGDILLQAYEAGADCRPIGLLDDDVRLDGSTLLGLPILGPITKLHELDHHAVIVAIGDNVMRARIFDSLCAQGHLSSTRFIQRLCWRRMSGWARA